uniref:Ribosome biogenesis regulatory protein homolog n=1 Tax=Globodera rostochiensis TaxID=31243 RepID=A0A914HCK7_GLORO
MSVVMETPHIDVGNLLLIDGEAQVDDLATINSEQICELTRKNAQRLFDEIWKLPRKIVQDATCSQLPECTYGLPREKPIPKPKEPTKWEKFARTKGITKKKGKKVWDKPSQEWKPTYGYRSANNQSKDWLIEIPDHKDPYKDYFAEKREGKRERVNKQELMRLKNIARLAAENASTGFLVSRRRLAFRPPHLATKKSNVAAFVSAEKSDTNGATSAQLPLNALKLYGKDFDAISKFMFKKKFNKDKDQDADWENIPRDAKELFVLLNGFEWRKRLKGLSFEEKKFRQLVMEGHTSFRPRRKKFIVNLKTPYCPALLKYFPYDKRNYEIPQHLSVKLTPLRNQDREFVVACEQNPFLIVQINVNDKILSLFDLLKRKWSLAARKMPNVQMSNEHTSSMDVGIRLFVGESNQIIHNVLVGNEGNSPLLSLTKLKKNFSPIEGAEIGKFVGSGRQSNEIKLNASSVKEVFEINEDKIRAGLSVQEVGNASMLQLFYMLGMKKELSFNYLFFDAQPDINNIFEMPKTTTTTTGVVERENAQFVEQLKTHCNIMQQKKPKRQIKLVPDNQRKFMRISAPVPTQQRVLKTNVAAQHFYMPENSVFGRTVHPHPQMSDVVLDTATDFSVFQNFSESRQTAQFNARFVPIAASSSATFQPIVLGNSPNKGLPEDVRTAYEQMLKENSIDYCRQFEQLANLHNDGSPIKTFDEGR